MYKVNKDYFKKIDSERKAYWLGFLYADGCICENKNKKTNNIKSMKLEIILKAIDKEHLELFLKDIESDSPVKYKKIKLGNKEFDSYRVQICNTEMCRDLIKLGCTPRKSLTVSFPTSDILPVEYIHHFIRGYFDGDGTAGIYHDKKRSRYIYNYGFVGTREMLDGITAYLLMFGFNKPKYRDAGKSYQFVYGNKGRMIKFYYLLYKDATIYLKRKYKVFARLPLNSVMD